MGKIPTNEQYERSELARFKNQLAEIENQGLPDRKAGKESFRYVLKEDPTSETPQFLAERASWLIDGNYGQGAQLAFQGLSKRMNRRAWLFSTLAALDFGCPLRAAYEVWNYLDPELQKEINQALDVVIEENDKKAE